MSKYRLLQLTNKNIGEIATNEHCPLGTITRRIESNLCSTPTFTISTSNVDTITISEEGYYKIIYNATLIATDAGEVEITLIINGNETYTIGTTAVAEETINLNLDFVTRVYKHCDNIATNNPMTIQFKSTGVSITSGVSNTIIERTY